MTSIEVKSKVDAHEVLNLSIPFRTEDANREVRVLVEQQSMRSRNRKLKSLEH